MKKNITIFAGIMFVAFAIQAQMQITSIFEDNFDGYTAGQLLCTQNNTDWDTWDGLPGSSQDALVTSELALSPSNALKITGINDILYRMGNYTTGFYRIEFDCYIPSSGNGGYFNIQHYADPGVSWAFECYFYNYGTGYLYVAGANTNFSYPSNSWFHVSIDVNLNNDLCTLTINGNVVKSWPFHYTATATTGNGAVNQLGGIDFFSSAPGTGTPQGTYFVDNFKVSVISTHIITATSGTGGAIAPSGIVHVIEGDNQKFTFLAYSGYTVDHLWIDGIETSDSISNGSYTFVNVTENHTIEVAFMREPCAEISNVAIAYNEYCTKAIINWETPDNMGQMVNVTLEAHDPWNDGTGYQLLLDQTATQYGITIPTTGSIWDGCDPPSMLYDVFSHIIPATATPSCNPPVTDWLVDGAITIQIPAGVYDWCIVNPEPDVNMWIAGSGGGIETSGRRDNYLFEEGYNYHFLMNKFASGDGVIITRKAIIPFCNIYRDGEKIAGPIIATSYEDATYDIFQPHIWSVAVVCPDGEDGEWMNIEKEVCPNYCAPPTQLAVNDITTYSANLVWNSNENVFNLEYGEEGFTQGAGTQINITDATSYALVNLLPNTTYDCYVQSVCNEGEYFSEWVKISFTTHEVCNPVTDFRVDYIPGCEAELTWGTPSKRLTIIQEDDDGEEFPYSAPPYGAANWLSWSGAIHTAIGIGSISTNDKIGARFTADDLATAGIFTGNKITKVKFVPWYISYITSVTIEIYQGGSWSPSINQGTLVHSQVVTQALEEQAYNEVTLTTLVEIDASQELWICYKIISTGGWPAGCDAGPAVNMKGNIVCWNGAWSTLSWDYNWNIEAYVTNDLPTSYNIYRDNALIKENCTDTFYTDVDFDLSEGHTWSVEAICKDGELSEWASVEKEACANYCFAPTQMNVSNLTSNSALLEWVSNKNSFNLEYGEWGFTQGAGTQVNITDATAYMLTDLLPTTTFDCYLQAVCNEGEDFSEWVKISFTTLEVCNPVTELTVEYLHGCMAQLTWVPPGKGRGASKQVEYIEPPQGSPNLTPEEKEAMLQRVDETADRAPVPEGFVPEPSIHVSEIASYVDAYVGDTYNGNYCSLYLANGAKTMVGSIDNPPFPSGEDFDGSDIYRLHATGAIGMIAKVSETGATTTIGTLTGASWNNTIGLAYDWLQNNGTWYFYNVETSAEPYNISFYSFNMATLVATKIGATNMDCPFMRGLTMAADGYLYAISITSSSLMKINPTTGVLTVVGPLGFTPRYGQELAFDRQANILYASPCNSSDQCMFGTINISTGAFTPIINYGTGQHATITITKSWNMDIPVAPTSFTLTPIAGVQPQCKLAWKNPMQTMEGTPLESISSIVIRRDDVTIHTINSDITVGANMTWIDNTVPGYGTYTYSVYAVNTEGNGLRASQQITIDEYFGNCLAKIAGNGATGTYEFPLNTYWKYSYVQEIIDASLLGDAGNITQIAFNFIKTSAITRNNQTIYLMNTDKTEFANTTDWIPISEFTQVFTGTINYNDSDTWFTIELDEPFEYTGGNLVIAYLNNHGAYEDNTPTFYKHTTTGYKTLHYRKDDTPAGPLNPDGFSTAATGRVQERGNIRFIMCPIIVYNVYRDGELIVGDISATTYTDEEFDEAHSHTWSVETVCQDGGLSEWASVEKEACALSCLTPVQLNASDVTHHSAFLEWISDHDSFNLEYGQEGFTQGSGTQINVTDATSYSLSNLWAYTNYDCYLQAVCNNGEGFSDWTKISFKTPHADVYTIDNTQPTENRNFNTFEEAVAFLNNVTLSGPITFEVISGQVHNITLTNYQGLYIAKTGTVDMLIIFRKLGSGANPLLKVTGTSNAILDACFYLENVNYITFDGLDIENAGTSGSNYLERGFHLQNANNITIANCSVKLPQTNTYLYGVYISRGNNNTIKNCNIELYRNGPNTFGVYTTDAINNLLIDGVNIKNSYYGCYFNENVYHSNNTVNQSVIDNVYHGIYVDCYGYSQNNFTIQESTITNASMYGILLCYGNNQRIYNNVVHSQSYGIYWGATNSTDTVYLAHNTVYIPSTANATYCIYKSSSNGRLGLYNNIFVNKSTSTSSRCFYINTSDNSNILQGSNNNIYYCENGAIYQSPSITKYTVNEYIELLGDGRESASWQTDVPFMSTVYPFSFDVDSTVPTKAESGGQPIEWITTDINGNPRYSAVGYTGTGTAPDIGAYEFEGIMDETDLSPLHGIYTIDNTRATDIENRNFNSFEDAITTLNTRGISDAVTFEVIAGQIHNIALTDYRGLRIVIGGTVDKPITFRKSGNEANPLLKVTGTSSTSDVCFYLDAANYITFDGLDIENAGTASSDYLEQGFYLINAHNISIINCGISLRNAANNYGIYAYNKINDLFTENVTLKNVYYGYYFHTNSNTITSTGNTITKNVIENVNTGIYAVDSYYGCNQNDFTISDTKITNASSYGIYLNYGNNQRVYNNEVHATGSYGIYLGNTNATDTVYLAYNTVYTTSTYCLRKSSSNGKLGLYNNIFINKSTNISSRCFYNATTDNSNILQGSNNNIYYCEQGAVYQNASVTKYTVTEYIELLGDGRESASHQVDVPFISTVYPFDLDVQSNVPTKAESGGQVISWITTDINGAPRYGVAGYTGTGTAPDIGAYEFDGTMDETDLSPLHGVYTIDNTLPTEDRNFNNFEDAIFALNTRGISDAVTFEVIAGQVHDITLTDYLGLRIVVSGTVDKPIVFRKSGTGDNPVLKVTGTTNNSSDRCFYLFGVNYITFDGIDVENAGTLSAWNENDQLEHAFVLENANNISIVNCNIRLTRESFYETYGIYSSGNCNNNSYYDNTIKQCYYGIYFSGVNANNDITTCIIDSVALGIFVYPSGFDRQNNFTIKESRIYNASSRGIYLSYGNNQRVYNNVIHGTSYAGIEWGIANTTDTVYLAQNTIYVLSTANTTTYCLYKPSSNGRLGLYNNIFINKSTSTSSRCFSNSTTDNSNILQNSNNNIYYCEQGAIYSGSVTKYTVNEYIELLGDGRESNSHQVDVPFISIVPPFNFDIDSTVPTKAESGGQPIEWITTDINGNPRYGAVGYTGTGTAPDIGAYEFDGIMDETDLSPLHGVYTIDNTLPTENRNFNSFEDAIFALNTRGISDAVNFEVIAGEIHDITLSHYYGLRIVSSGTVDKPIIFHKVGSEGNPLLKVAGTSNTSSDACFYLDGVNYITFDGIDIENAGTSSSNYLERGFHLQNANNITITNCSVKLSQTSTYLYGIYVSQGNNNIIQDCNIELYRSGSNTFGIYTTSTVNNLLIDNVNIKNAYYGYYLYGTHNTISRALIDNVAYGVYSYGSANNFTIKESKIYNANSYGINLSSGNNQRVYNNVIHGISYGIYITSTSTIDTVYLAHNTVYIPPTTNTTYSVRKNSANGKLGLYNNILINKSTSATSSCFYNATSDNSNLLQGSNNNIYYKTNGYIYGSPAVSANSIEAYRTLLGDDRENNSVEEDVPFISPAYPFNFDINPDIPTAAESGGQQISWITTDIEGNLRYGAPDYAGSGFAPDIGAYEFEGKGLFSQYICSGDSTELVDFTTFYQGANVTYELTKYPNATIGYVTSGVNVLPKMELINSSNQLDTLIYTTTPEMGTPLNYTIKVRPQLQIGNFSENLFPPDGSVVQNIPVTFSWQVVQGAAFYDFYLWDETGQCPAQPTRANLQVLQYTHSANLVYGNSYKWKVIAKNMCTHVESDIYSFNLRTLPDLHVTHVDVSEAYSGKPVTISWTVKNDGTTKTIESLWYDRIWLVSEIINGTAALYSKLLVQVPNLHGLDPGQSYSNSVEVILPEREVGLHYIIVTTDMQYVTNINWNITGSSIPPDPYTPNVSGNPYPYLFANCGYKTVAEESDNNGRCDNFFYKRMDILTPPLPDLQVESIIVSPTNFFSGNEVTVTATIINAGMAPTPNIEWIDVLYFSKGANFGDSVVYNLKTVSHREVLEPNNSYTVTFTTYTPLDVFGECYFYVHTNASNSVYEHIFSNNNISRSNAVNVILSPTADLLPVSLSVPSTLSTGAAFNVSSTIRNQGLVVTNTPNWTDRIYISTNPDQLDATAIQLDNIPHSGWLYGESDWTYEIPNWFPPTVWMGPREYSLSRSINLPNLSAGIYYLYLHVDATNQVFEYNAKTNNIRRSQPITVQKPDLTGNVTSAVPDTVYTGKEYGVNWQIKNLGQGTISNKNVTDRIFFKKVSNPMDSTILISLDYNIASLQNDQSLTKNAILNAAHTMEEGRYNMYLRVNATNTLFESNLLNNLSLVKEVYLKRSLLPDLVPVSAIAPNSAEINETINTTLRVSNIGTKDLNQNCPISVYVSDVSSYNNLAIPCSIVSQTPALSFLAAGTFIDVELQVRIPDNIPKGNKYLIFILDQNNQVDEINKSNNTLAKQIFIDGKYIDLLVENLQAPSNCMSGAPITVSWQVRNVGNLAPNRIWNDAIYASSSNVFNPSTAVLLVQISNTTTQLPYTNSRMVSIPHQFHGLAYIHVVTDAYKEINDYDRSNNTATVPVSVTLSDIPDLRLFGINALSQATVGQPYKITYTVDNIGTAELPPTRLTDAFYLSMSNVLNLQTAILIGDKSAQRELSVGQYYTDSLEIVLPATVIAGNYYLFGKTDATDVLYETNKMNNIFSIPVVVRVPPPVDLVVTDINYPNSALVGESATFAWQIKNEGFNIAEGQTKDVILLSPNDTWDNSSVFIGSKDVTLTLEPNATTLQTWTGELTGVPCGNYHVIVKTNATNTIPETDYDNNTRISLGKVTIDYPALEIDAVENTTLTADRKYKYYKLVIDNVFEDQTLLCELTCNQTNTFNSIYISYQAVPTPAIYDYSGAAPNKGNQRIIIPKLKQGTYYLLVRNYDATTNNVDVDLLASIINFSVIAVDKGKGANIGSVTVKVDGAKFDTIMDFRLRKSGEIIPTENIIFKDETRTFATFNIANASLGKYDMVAELPGGVLTSLDNAYEIITGKPAELHTEFIAPASVRRGDKYTITLDYGNIGDVDLYISDFLIISENGDPIALTYQELDSAFTEIRMPVGNRLGTPGILPPGAYDSQTIYVYSTTPLASLQLYVIRKLKR
jgi:hypothetical protein